MLRNSATIPVLSGALRIAALLACSLAVAAPAAAQSPVLFSPDITAELGTVGPSLIADDDAASDDAAGTVVPVLLTMLGAIPESSEVAGLELSTTSPPLLTLDTTAALPGLIIGAPAEPRDVVSWDPNTSTFAYFFDGSINGVPEGVRIDAVSQDAAGLLLSFDTSVSLPGVGFVEDEDLVRFAGGLYSMVFDGSVNGVAPGLDLDAATRGTGFNLLISFDASGTLGAISFVDEDTLAFDTALLTYAMHLDASTSDPVDWPSVDLVALPEPGFGVSLGCATLTLMLLSRNRARLGRK